MLFPAKFRQPNRVRRQPKPNMAASEPAIHVAGSGTIDTRSKSNWNEAGFPANSAGVNTPICTFPTLDKTLL
jgi:hypothetical protein